MSRENKSLTSHQQQMIEWSKGSASASVRSKSLPSTSVRRSKSSSLPDTLLSQQRLMNYFADLYPNTNGRHIEHYSQRNSRPVCIGLSERQCDAATDCIWNPSIGCGEVQYWSGTVYSVTNDISTGGIGAYEDGPGDCLANFMQLVEFDSGITSTLYNCEGFCCDGNLPDAIPEQGDGVADMSTMQEYEAAGWLCFDEGTRHPNWSCCKPSTPGSCHNDNGFVSYESNGPAGSFNSPGCNPLDSESCRAWEGHGYCKLLQYECEGENQCTEEEGDQSICVNTVDNMARKVYINSDVDAYSEPWVMDQIAKCCDIGCPTEWGWNMMMCETEDGVDMHCICPGACPSGGWGWGTTYCFGCNEPIENNQDDACDYPYYDGVDWCHTAPGRGYSGECV